MQFNNACYLFLYFYVQKPTFRQNTVKIHGTYTLTASFVLALHTVFVDDEVKDAPTAQKLPLNRHVWYIVDGPKGHGSNIQHT